MDNSFVGIVRASLSALSIVRESQSAESLEAFLNLPLSTVIRNLYRALDQEGWSETAAETGRGQLAPQGNSEKIAAFEYFASLSDQELEEVFRSVTISLSVSASEISAQFKTGFVEPLLYLVSPELTIIEAQKLLRKAYAQLDRSLLECGSTVLATFNEIAGTASAGSSIPGIDRAELATMMTENAQAIVTSAKLLHLVNDYTGYTVPPEFLRESFECVGNLSCLGDSENDVASTANQEHEPLAPPEGYQFASFVERCERTLIAPESEDEFGSLSDEIVASENLSHAVAVALRAYQVERLIATERYDYAQRILKYLQSLVVNCEIRSDFLAQIWNVIFTSYMAFVQSGRNMNLNKALVQYMSRALPSESQEQFRADLAQANPLLWKD